MIRNFFVVAIRNLLKKKFYSFLNIFGLTIGITASLLIILHISDELSYDRFQSKIDRMYRVALHGKLGGQDILGAWTPSPMAAALKSDIPEVAEAIRMWQWSDVIVKYGDKSFTENNVFHTDSNFFQFFSFKLLEGDPETALKEPNSMVITQSIAHKLFGDEDPLNKIVIFSNDAKAMKITGVTADPPENSSIKFNYLVSFSSNDFGRSNNWLSNSLQTYFILNKGSDIQAAKKKINDLIPKYVGPILQQALGISLEQFRKNGGVYGYIVDPFKDIHLYNHIEGDLGPAGNITYIYIFGAIGFFILLIASINFMNLTTARSSGRAREVGMRKTFGSLKSQLMAQFLMESMIFSLIAVILAFILTAVLLPEYNLLSGKELTRASLLNSNFILGAVVLIIIVGLFAGSYPAFYLTRFKIVEVFKGGAAKGTKGGWIRGTLVTIQFAISILLIICTSLVFTQMEYTRNKDLGFDRKNVIIVSNTDKLGSNRSPFKEELIKDQGISSASYSTNTFPGINNRTVFRKPGVDEDHICGQYYADYDQVPTLKLRIIEGRNFSRDFPSDSSAILVNQALVKELGWENPVGERLMSFNGPKPEELRVVGVIEDFNFESLREKVFPLVIRLGATFGNEMSVRYSGINPNKAVKEIESKWKEFASGEPFQYNFLDDRFNDLYQSDMRIGKLLTIFTGLAILIACLGLFGLAAYTAEQRTREIGIRKAMGASSLSIVRLMNSEFVKFILIAFIVAVVPAWYFITNWLQHFVYRVPVNYFIFVLSGVAALVIALLTVSYQSVKAARVNPAETLRYE